MPWPQEEKIGPKKKSVIGPHIDRRPPVFDDSPSLLDLGHLATSGRPHEADQMMETGTVND